MEAVFSCCFCFRDKHNYENVWMFHSSFLTEATAPSRKGNSSPGGLVLQNSSQIHSQNVKICLISLPNDSVNDLKSCNIPMSALTLTQVEWFPQLNINYPSAVHIRPSLVLTLPLLPPSPKSFP